MVNKVRHQFHGYNHYWTPDWYRHHPHAWYPHRVPSYRWWYRPSWYDTWAWFGAGFFTGVVIDNALDPYPYYYGNNIVYRGNMVYVNGVPYVSASEYYRQAAELARSVEPQEIEVRHVVQDDEPALAPPKEGVRQEVAKPVPEEKDWMPMGTFAVLKGGEDVENEETGNVLQLATNKEGQIRGNYYSEETGDVRQLAGAVDAKSQRVALRFVDDERTVLECGLWNLTQDSVPLLIHFDENDTEQLTLIRLTDPDASSPKTEKNDRVGPVLPDSDGELAP